MRWWLTHDARTDICCPNREKAFKMQKTEAPAQATSGVNVSKRRKFVADGVFYAELNEFFQRELAEEGYSGVEVRVTPTVTDIIIRATHTQEVLGEQGRRIREVSHCYMTIGGQGIIDLPGFKVDEPDHAPLPLSPGFCLALRRKGAVSRSVRRCSMRVSSLQAPERPCRPSCMLWCASVCHKLSNPLT